MIIEPGKKRGDARRSATRVKENGNGEAGTADTVEVGETRGRGEFIRLAIAAAGVLFTLIGLFVVLGGRK